jgi:hypothetical protein
MISLLIYMLVVCLVAGVVVYVIGLFGIAQPYARIAQGVVALIAVLAIIGAVFGGISVPWVVH